MRVDRCMAAQRARIAERTSEEFGASYSGGLLGREKPLEVQSGSAMAAPQPCLVEHVAWANFQWHVSLACAARHSKLQTLFVGWLDFALFCCSSELSQPVTPRWKHSSP